MKMVEIKKKHIDWLRDSFVENAKDFSIGGNLPLPEATTKLLNSPQKILPIVDEFKKVVGIVTRSDIARSVIDISQNILNPKEQVSKVANKNFVGVKKADTISDLMYKFLVNEKIENVIVTDNEGKLFGIVNRTKFVSEMRELIK